MAISTAVPAGSISRTSGYQLNKGNFSTVQPYLPQQVVILGEANTSNQAALLTTPVQITSAAQAGQKYGYGSPIHSIARILFPQSGTGIAGVPVYVMAQAEASGATATVIVLTITGTATASKTHYLSIAGRKSLDAVNYAVNIVTGDTATVIAGKYVAAINAVLGSPVTATNTAGAITLTAKWKGATGAGLTAVPDVNGNAAGLTYAITSNTAGTGTPDIATALTQFEQWYTLVLNSYGTAKLADLEAFNGAPDNDNPSGRYSPDVFKPILSFFGSTESTVANLIAITDATARKSNVTNVLSPAPGSAGMPYEAAANMLMLFANVAQSQPHSTAAGKSYRDMPIPDTGLIGEMSIYANRDSLKKKGCSTVTLKDGAYKVQDLVTTYHPDGENPLVFSEARYLVIDWNVKYGYGILEDTFLKDKTIVGDDQYTTVQNVIKVSDWKAICFTYFDSLAELGLIRDPEFSKDSLQVEVDATNPNRFNTAFDYIRTGTAEVESTTATVGFRNF
jgi:phage tail sheath gpL-like